MVGGQDEREPDQDDGGSRSAPRSPTKLHGWKNWLRILIALFITVGGFAFIATQYLEIRAGRGGELHRSMWGYKVSPIGILVTAGASLAVLPAISVIEWLLHRRDRALGRKQRRKPT
jgi:fatty acid desaturase